MLKASYDGQDVQQFCIMRLYMPENTSLLDLPASRTYFFRSMWIEIIRKGKSMLIGDINPTFPFSWLDSLVRSRQNNSQPLTVYRSRQGLLSLEESGIAQTKSLYKFDRGICGCIESVFVANPMSMAATLTTRSHL